MKVASLKSIVLSALAVSCAGLVHGQTIGLQTADTAESRAAGKAEVTAGAMLGSDLHFYGARGTYTLLNELRGFADVGLVGVSDADASFGAQIGALYSLPDEFISDLGIRATGYYADTYRKGFLGGTLMLISSDETLIPDLFVYGGLGVDISRHEFHAIPGSDRYTKDETKPVGTVGLIYYFTQNVGVYTEGSYRDPDFFFGLGVKVR